MALKIIVTAKQVIDPEIPKSAFKIDAANKRVVVPASFPPVVNGFDEHAVEAALRIKDAQETQVTVLGLGKTFSIDVMRKLLAMGADDMILVQDPAWLTPARYRRFVRRAQLEALLPDHLVLGEPYLALNALLLEPGELELLAQLTETFSRAFQRAGQALADDVPALVALGFPWAAAELLAGEPRRMPLVGRFDFVLDTAGHWWLLEFRCEIVVVRAAGTGTLVVTARTDSELVHRVFFATSGNYTSPNTNGSGIASAGVTAGQRYQVFVGIPNGMPAQRIDVSTTVK